MKHAIYIFVFLFLSSCGLNSDIMLKTDDKFQFDKFQSQFEKEYKISPNDKLEFRLFSSDGFQLVDVTEATSAIQQSTQISYTVDRSGFVKLPSIGAIQLSGYTVREAEIILEDEYLKFYKRPFVLLKITNKRVTIFPGDGGKARVITLENDNTTLIEALALAGGIADRGKAKKVKLIRRENDNSRKIFEFDLSTINGLRYGDMVVQAEDIIYVEPTPEATQKIVKDVSLIASLISSFLTIYTILTL